MGRAWEKEVYLKMERVPWKKNNGDSDLANPSNQSVLRFHVKRGGLCVLELRTKDKV